MTYTIIPAEQLAQEDEKIIYALEQGAIVRNIWVIASVPDDEHKEVLRFKSPVIVLSQGCEIDKKASESVLVACVLKLSTLPKQFHGNIRKNIVLNAFYLPNVAPMPEECYIDWRTIQPVSKLAVVKARASEDYVCTIIDPMLTELRGRYWDYFFRPLPRPGS